MMHLKKLPIFFFTLILVSNHSSFAFHTTNRYFPFFERPEELLPKKHYVQVSPFYATATTAFNQRWGTGKIAQLSGDYNLQDVITSLEFVKGSNFINPIIKETGSNDFVGKSIPMTVSSKIQSIGLSVRAEEYFPSLHLTIGAWVPFAWLNTIAHYQFTDRDRTVFASQFPAAERIKLMSDQTAEIIDQIRRRTHDEIGFCKNISSKVAIGDPDIYLRWNYFLDHRFLMKSININVQTGVLVPLGEREDRDIPSSVPFMGGGHWGIYSTIVPELELKQDIKIGLMFSILFQLAKNKMIRMPVYKEPANFSALEGCFYVDPGITIKLAPYLILENITDGLHFQARYNYVRHADDDIQDNRANKTIPSYLNIRPDDFASITETSENVTDLTICQNAKNKEALTKWRSHYITLQLTYELPQQEKNTNRHKLNQRIYAFYDMPISGKSVSKTHQLTFGYERSF